MQYPNGKSIKMVRPNIRSERTGIVEIKQGPMLGENTVELMKEYGYDDAQIEKMLADGAVKQHD